MEIATVLFSIMCLLLVLLFFILLTSGFYLSMFNFVVKEKKLNQEQQDELLKQITAAQYRLDQSYNSTPFF